jgi:hypothetical protein
LSQITQGGENGEAAGFLAAGGSPGHGRDTSRRHDLPNWEFLNIILRSRASQYLLRADPGTMSRYLS